MDGWVVVYLRCSGGCDGWLTFEDDDAIRKICRHYEIVLDNESSFLRMQDESVRISVKKPRA